MKPREMGHRGYQLFVRGTHDKLEDDNRNTAVMVSLRVLVIIIIVVICGLVQLSAQARACVQHMQYVLTNASCRTECKNQEEWLH